MLVVAAAIPWLAQILGALLGELIKWFAKYFTKKTATYFAASAAILALSATYYAAGYALIHSLLSYLPPHYEAALALVMPDNVEFCISAIATTRTARWVFVWNYRWIQTTSQT